MPTKPLARCPACDGTIIYPLDLAGLDGGMVVSRRCPECAHRDLVVAGRLPALLWFERNLRLRGELAALCDAVADGLPLEVEIALEQELQRVAADAPDAAARELRKAPPR